MPRVEGKVAVVIGSGRPGGIGTACAEALAREGAAVVLADLDVQTAQAAADGICAEGGTATALQVDLQSPESISRLIDQTVARYGGLDVLHCNAIAAGMLGSRDGAIGDLDLDVWAASFDINTRGTALAIKYAIPHLIARGGGSIICTSSAASTHAEATRTVYAATKAAINSLIRSTAAQYGKAGVRANAVAPGVILTPGAMKVLSAEQLARMERHHLTPRLGLPEDIAAAVVFLASDESAFLTGQVVNVDGGLTVHNPTLADDR